jgi:hypothetical protein
MTFGVGRDGSDCTAFKLAAEGSCCWLPGWSRVATVGTSDVSVMMHCDFDVEITEYGDGDTWSAPESPDNVLLAPWKAPTTVLHISSVGSQRAVNVRNGAATFRSASK